MMKLHIEISDELAEALLAEALDGVGPSVRARAEKSDTLRRELIRDAITERLSR
jgi:hypothetical protein